jgi:hypothetical protein
LETIRVLAREQKAEIFFHTRSNSSPVESIHKVSSSIILDYIESWQNWLKQIDALSYALPEKDIHYLDRFHEFSKSLSSILFGNFFISFSNETVWILDKEFMELPVEILKQNPKQIFYRNIRSTQIPPSDKVGEDLLFVENHYEAKNLLEELNRERIEITEFWDLKKISYRELIGASCTRARFIEKITSAKVVHYSGHSFEDGLWFIDESFLEISDISSLNLSNLELVSLNSCSSAIGLARGFLEAGVKECVGFLGPVRNDISREAGTIFWDWYLKSGSASQSTQKVRDVLQSRHGVGYPAAFQFVHFGIPKHRYLYVNKKLIIGLSSLVGFLFFSIYIFYFSSFKKEPIEEAIKNTEKETKTQNLDSKGSELEFEERTIYQDKIPFKNSYTDKKKLDPSNYKEKVLNKKFTDPVEPKTIKMFTIENKFQNMNTINEQVNPLESRLEKYIVALTSEKLKKDIWNYLKKRDPLVSLDRKREKIEKILESTDSEELIEYKLRDLE